MHRFPSSKQGPCLQRIPPTIKIDVRSCQWGVRACWVLVAAALPRARAPSPVDPLFCMFVSQMHRQAHHPAALKHPHEGTQISGAHPVHVQAMQVAGPLPRAAVEAAKVATALHMGAELRSVALELPPSPLAVCSSMMASRQLSPLPHVCACFWQRCRLFRTSDGHLHPASRRFTNPSLPLPLNTAYAITLIRGQGEDQEGEEREGGGGGTLSLFLQRHNETTATTGTAGRISEWLGSTYREMQPYRGRRRGFGEWVAG